MSIEVAVADAIVETALNEDGLERPIHKFGGGVIPDNMIPGIHGYTVRLDVAKDDDLISRIVVAYEEGRTVHWIVEIAVDGRLGHPWSARALWMHQVRSRSITAEL
jgi:hypothetical protein